MRHLSVSTRLTLALSLSALALLGAGGAWQFAAEESDLRRATARELRLLGRSLAVAFENALRDRQAEDVEETLRALERIDPSVDILVYDPAGHRLAASSGARERPSRLDPRGSGVRFRDAERTVELLLPLAGAAGQPPSTLVLVSSTDRMERDLDATRRRIVLSLAVLVLAVILVSTTLTRFWVGRPLAAMVSRMRRVRAGDLTPAERRAARRDEIGATLMEFEALVADLGEARERLDAEAEARRRLELGLREVDKLAAIGQLAAGLAHEIGSPLQVLEGRIAGLEEKAEDPGETRRLAKILREQTQRITRIVSRLTSLARRRPGSTQRLDPGPPVRAVVDLLEGEARRRRLALSVEIAPALPLVRGDADALQQIALNVLRNAFDATPAGGSVAVRMRAAELARPDLPTEPAVRLEIEDTGRGMRDDELARAFEPFFTTREDGTGLGLAIVKGIVDELGGVVRIESNEGPGTRFVVLLPCEVTEEASP